MPGGRIAPDDPVTIGHETIDWGADIVIGNHPHWYQGVEGYHGKLITYAHGNFFFMQLCGASWNALRIYDFGQPVFMNQGDNAAALQTMEAASDELAARQ